MIYTYNLIPFIDNFRNASSKLMNVNGSVTPQVFSYVPPASEVAALTELTVALKDDGTTALTNFAAIAALTNGVLISANVGGITKTIATIKDNADLATRFTFSQFGNGAVLSILGLGTAQGFGSSNNIFIGSMQLPEPIVLDSSQGDSLSVTIQDNLSAVDIFQMGFHAVRLA